MLLLLPLLFFGAALYGFRLASFRSSMREALLKASVVWGVTVIAITELLTPFSALTTENLALCWAIASVLALGVIWRRAPIWPRVPSLKLQWT